MPRPDFFDATAIRSLEVLMMCLFVLLAAQRIRIPWLSLGTVLVAGSWELYTAGAWANNACQYANDGLMPVAVDYPVTDIDHSNVVERTRLVMLADIFRVPDWVPSRILAAGTASIGDFLIVGSEPIRDTGILIGVAALALARRRR